MAEKRFVYADNAATSPLSPTALEAMMPFLQSNYANASQPYSFAREARKALSQSRKIIAECINASPEEIYFTSGGSESNNWVINGAIDFEMDILTTAIEHHSILRPAQYAAEIGSKLSIIPVSETGIVELPELYQRIQNPGSLVSIMLANNEIGTIQHIADLAQLCHDVKCIFHTDAVQALGHVKIDVKALGIDMLSGSAHKFNGPKGIGFLYVKNSIKWPALIKGGLQEFGFRAGTENVASIVGMATALKENVSNTDMHTLHLNKLESILLRELVSRGISYKRNGDSRHIPGNLSLSFDGLEGETLLHRLDFKGIMVSTGSACDSKETQISHVLKAIGLDESLAKGTIRISLGHQNTEADVKYIAEELSSMIKSLESQDTLIADEPQNKDSIILDNISPTSELNESVEVPTSNSKLFYINTIGCNAVGRLLPNNQISILKDSIIRLEATPTFARIQFREEIIREYCMKETNGYRVLRDLPPMSPSSASGLVQGRSSNGKRDWLDANSRKLGEFL